jgi:hypothetical protein
LCVDILLSNTKTLPVLVSSISDPRSSEFIKIFSVQCRLCLFLNLAYLIRHTFQQIMQLVPPVLACRLLLYRHRIMATLGLKFGEIWQPRDCNMWLSWLTLTEERTVIHPWLTFNLKLRTKVLNLIVKVQYYVALCFVLQLPHFNKSWRM